MHRTPAVSSARTHTHEQSHFVLELTSVIVADNVKISRWHTHIGHVGLDGIHEPHQLANLVRACIVMSLSRMRLMICDSDLLINVGVIVGIDGCWQYRAWNTIEWHNPFLNRTTDSTEDIVR